MKECEWMAYHLTVHTMIIPMGKKTNKLTPMRGEGEKERERGKETECLEGGSDGGEGETETARERERGVEGGGGYLIREKERGGRGKEE